MTAWPDSDLHVGISGWRYPPWRGAWYPAGLAQRRELAWASRRLGSIELNGSFYALQRPSSYERWYADTPDGFVFAVKGPRFVTHLKKLAGVEVPPRFEFAPGERKQIRGYPVQSPNGRPALTSSPKLRRHALTCPSAYDYPTPPGRSTHVGWCPTAYSPVATRRDILEPANSVAGQASRRPRTSSGNSQYLEPPADGRESRSEQALTELHSRSKMRRHQLAEDEGPGP